MKICNHNIAQSEIIGIGPLMINKSLNSAFGEVHFSFQVHCKHQSIEIKSERETMFGSDQHKTEAKARLEKFKADYESALSLIFNSIKK